MNHYDDLQRFKDKTRTQQHDFVDLSSQNLASEHGNWAIINQLAPVTEESALAMGGHVSLAIPQAVDPDLFAIREHHAPVAEPVNTPVPASSAPSIFQGVASQLAAAPAALSVPPAAPVAAPVEQPDVTLAKPAAAPKAAPAAPVNFSQLFAPKAAETKDKVEKNQPLKSLLERIASCR